MPSRAHLVNLRGCLQIYFNSCWCLCSEIFTNFASVRDRVRHLNVILLLIPCAKYQYTYAFTFKKYYDFLQRIPFLALLIFCGNPLGPKRRITGCGQLLKNQNAYFSQQYQHQKKIIFCKRFDGTGSGGMSRLVIIIELLRGIRISANISYFIRINRIVLKGYPIRAYSVFRIIIQKLKPTYNSAQESAIR